jgi:hypothetical protein
LAKDNCPQQIKAIEQAIFMPGLYEYNVETRKYPHCGANLMENPFPKKKKTKKKKGKKK